MPGVIGLSLMTLDLETGLGDANTIGFPLGNGPSQQSFLVRGIQQILATTPAFLEFCEFQFGPYQVELHKVETDAVLLVLSEGQPSTQHSKAVSELLQFIKADYAALVDSIQTLKADDNAYQSMSLDPVITTDPGVTADLTEVVAAMNSLSQMTIRYLGTPLVANHWRTLQEPQLSKFSIGNDGKISAAGAESQLSPEQLSAIRHWALRFHQRCTRIIRDYDGLVEQALPEHERWLLFGEETQKSDLEP